MIKMPGKDNYDNAFDWFKWSAPVYENPEEFLKAFQESGVSGKTLQSVRIIGAVMNITALKEKAYAKVSLWDLDENQTKQVGIDNLNLDCSLQLCEPLVFEFTDGTSMELLPMESGKIRFSENTIPESIMDGLNHQNYNITALEEYLPIGMDLTDCHILERADLTVSHWRYGNEHRAYRHERNRKYDYSLQFHSVERSSVHLNLTAGWANGYYLKLSDLDTYDNVSYYQFADGFRRENQIEVLAGREPGGSFWVNTVAIEDRQIKKNLSALGYNGISIDDRGIDCLAYYLHKAFDPALPNEGFGRDEGQRFDYNGVNLYTYNTMQQMISDIQETVQYIETDYDNPIVKERIKAITVSTLEGAEAWPDKSVDRDQCVREHIGIAIDFYYRFCNRIKAMMDNNPEMNAICFSGP